MALVSNTPIATPDGWAPLYQISSGQTVFDQAGQQCTVLAVCHRGLEPVYRVMFDDGSCLVAGAQHPWVTLTHSLRHQIHVGNFALPDWAWNFAPPTTEQVKACLIHRRKSLVESMHSVPVAMPLILPERELPIDPYLLGLWLGDGSSGSPVITSEWKDEPHYRDRALLAGENWRIMGDKKGVLTCSMARGSHPLFLHRLRDLEVFNNKHIPPVYLRASAPQRLELLRGLMDSDGCIGRRAGQAEFTSISPDLSGGHWSWSSPSV